MSRKFSLNNLFANNRYAMIFSFVIALTSWFIISIQVSPITTKDMPDLPVTVSLSDTAFNNLKAYKGGDTKVQVSVRGKKYIIDRLKAEDIDVSANVSPVVGVGTYVLDISAKSSTSSLAGDFDIVSVSPSQISIQFDNEVKKDFDVSIQLNGAATEAVHSTSEIYVIETEFAEEKDKVISVTGPDNEVKRIAKVAAVADVDRVLTTTEQIATHVIMYDEAGTVIYDNREDQDSTLKYITGDFNDKNVVANLYMIKTVPLKITYRNAPKTLPVIKIYEDTGSASSSLTPVSVVRIKGEPSVVRNIDSVTLDGTVDFSEFSSARSSSWKKSLKLPYISGVAYADYANVSDIVSFIVTADSSGYISKTVDIPAGNVSVTNAPAGGSPVVQSALKGVTVIGPSTAIRNITAAQVKVYIDASELTAGSYTKNATFVVDNAYCWVAGQYPVTVQIP